MVIDNTNYYVELTNNKLPFCALPEADLNANILQIPHSAAGQSSFVNGNSLGKLQMPARTENKNIRSKQIKIDGYNIIAECKNLHIGDLASIMRLIYASLGAQERDKKLAEAVAEDWTVPVKLSDVRFENLDNLTDSVIYSQTLTAAGAVQDLAGMMIFKLPWTDGIRSHSRVSLEKRKFNIEFWQYIYADSQYEQINLTIPKGKTLVEIPKNIKYECPAADFEIQFETSGKSVLTATRKFIKKKDTVTPEEYADFKQFITDVSAADNKQYAIK
jgi:hypothetical protein